MFWHKRKIVFMSVVTFFLGFFDAMLYFLMKVEMLIMLIDGGYLGQDQSFLFVLLMLYGDVDGYVLSLLVRCKYV